MTLKESGMLIANTKLQYLHTLLRGEAPYEFYTFCIIIGSKNMSHLNQSILGLGTYFTLGNALSEQKRAMRHIMRKKNVLYAARMVDLNE